MNTDNNALWTAREYFAVTPNDSADLASRVRALMVTSAGSLRLTRIDGTVVNLTVPAGTLPIVAIRVHATGTSATGITGLV
jgi:hypothetical protein